MLVYRVSKDKHADISSGRFVTSYRIDPVNADDYDVVMNGLPQSCYASLIDACAALDELIYPEIKLK